VLVLGVSYKPDVGDTRESPALDIIELLRNQGARVDYHDPFVPTLALDSGNLVSRELTPEILKTSDAVVVAANHSDVDYALVLEHARIVVDPRNGLNGSRGNALVYPIAGPPRGPSSEPSERPSELEIPAGSIR
jgi:UDP-N-acetyl-D-mannosaminuronate dehydrogenase